MNLSRLFILRPVATSLLMVAMLIAGALAYRWLPIAALPQVDYPTIQVSTLYPGASPEVVTSAITAPLERQFGQMPGLDLMSSSSSRRSLRINDNAKRNARQRPHSLTRRGWRVRLAVSCHSLQLRCW